MFDTASVMVDDAVSCADALVDSMATERRVVAERLALVAAWADLHCPGPELPETLPAPERARREGREQVAAEGTPRLTPTAVVELGMVLQTTTYAAESLVRDVLELRHRLPSHWEAVQSGRVEGWKARQVAKLTHPLSLEQASWVDAEVIDAVLGLPWGRAKAVVEGKVIAADLEAHRARLAEEESRPFVSTRRRSNTAGMRTLIARGPAGDIARVEAMVAHLAAGLKSAGDPDPADTRWAKALAMMANPALACVLLAQSHDPAPACTPAATPQPEPVPVPSAAELAVELGRILRDLGARAVDRLRPRSVLYLHLSAEAVQGMKDAGVARVDDPVAGGPISTEQLRGWLGHDRVVVKPVLDPTEALPVDAYEVPRHLREAAELLTPYEMFPYGTLPSRQADLDHSVPYVPVDKGGGPGQTSLRNLGPLGRRHHLAKTFAGFTVHHVAVGLFLWRSPTGHWFRVDHRGTAHLGRDRPAALDTATRHDPATMSSMETRLRDAIVRHVAA